ncbi:MAG TPA: ribonuclease III [Thermodesulfobacteriota bacterium]|jgi:ribonuclease-3|nr:ribonuclease III [Thermodesulfobacteriota bacterium]
MIEKKLGYRFKDRNLLKTSLTHSSYANESSVISNERLEFLGDAVLGCVVARFLYDRFPEASEGKLSKMRSAIVSRFNFARFAVDLGIDKEILLGKGEELTGGRKRESNLAGAFEALIGAVYLDGGYRRVFQVISRLLKDCLDRKEIFIDYKTRLQELAQKQYKIMPKYKVVLEEGPPHDKCFHVEVKVARKVLGRGLGRNKKEAEQAAAKEGLENLGLLDQSKR